MADGDEQIGYFAIKLLPVGAETGTEGDRPQIASVKAPNLSEAVALALRRYPGYIAVHGERH